MPTKSAAQPDVDLDALAQHLVSDGLDLAGPLQVSLLAGGRSNPTYGLTDGRSSWVLRRPPYGEFVASAHDVLRESRILRALASSAVPVPTVVASCDDATVLGADFYIMERLEGRTFRTREDTAVLTTDESAKLADAIVDTLTTLHEVDPAAAGLADLGRPVGYLERQLSRWTRQWDAVRTRDGDEVEELARRLTASMPPSPHLGIVHGDYKIDNLMVALDDPGTVVGLLDWEMATLGDTLADLGQLVSFWDEMGSVFNPITAGATAHEGFPTGREVIEAYATRRGIEPAGIEWYVVFADFKLAVILEQIHARHLAGTTVGEGFDDVGAMVEPILLRALERCAYADDPRLHG